MAGTSVAVPYVSGAIALLLVNIPGGNRNRDQAGGHCVPYREAWECSAAVVGRLGSISDDPGGRTWEEKLAPRPFRVHIPGFLHEREVGLETS